MLPSSDSRLQLNFARMNLRSGACLNGLLRVILGQIPDA